MEETNTRQGRTLRRIGIFVNRLVYNTVDRGVDRLHVMLRERELFFGAGSILLGLLNFNVGRYCDGNTAEYLSCTRPAVYYYFDVLDIALIILGVFAVLMWFVRDSHV